MPKHPANCTLLAHTPEQPRPGTKSEPTVLVCFHCAERDPSSWNPPKTSKVFLPGTRRKVRVKWLSMTHLEPCKALLVVQASVPMLLRAQRTENLWMTNAQYS